jgi:hypothetical protein
MWAFRRLKVILLEQTSFAADVHRSSEIEKRKSVCSIWRYLSAKHHPDHGALREPNAETFAGAVMTDTPAAERETGRYGFRHRSLLPCRSGQPDQ